MAKTLRDSTPTSSVARLLDREAANRALQSNPLATPWPAQPGAMTSAPETALPSPEDVPRIKREFILTQEAEDTFCEMLALVRRTTRCRVTASQFFRAMLKAAHWSMPSLAYEAHQLGPQRMPGNGRSAQAQREAFEQRLAAAFAAGIRPAATPPVRADEPAQIRDRPGR